MKIGLSLSYCVIDIAAGRVELDDVSHIIASTCLDLDDKDMLHEYASNKYGWTSKHHEILDELVNTGRVLQPRKQGCGVLVIAGGHWVDVPWIYWL